MGQQRRDEPASDGADEHAAVSGRYGGHEAGGKQSIELRVDVDGDVQTGRVSADIFDIVSDAGRDKREYKGSFWLDPRIDVDGDGLMTMTGRAGFSWETATPNVTVTIPRLAPGGARTAALQRSAPNGAPGPSYGCEFESPNLRSVVLIEDVQDGVVPFGRFEAGKEFGNRTLRIVDALADARIELLPSPASESIEGADDVWSDAELYTAMRNRLSAVTGPEWAIWLLHARNHDRNIDAASEGERLVGLMFDDFDERQRQGCAVFYAFMEDDLRLQLHTCVHELGHAFNLHHCFRETLAGPARENSLSWMNYAHRYPAGPQAYWDAFKFGFDDVELRHLRHGFRNDVIMGGAPFVVRRQFEIDDWYGRPQSDGSGLQLGLGVPPALEYGVPVTVELALTATRPDSQQVPSVLGPRPGTVDVVIRRPDGQQKLFRPLLHHCRDDRPVPLAAGALPVKDHAFVHYGKDGFAFPDPGMYELRARYEAPDGSIVLSDVVSTYVPAPSSTADRDAERYVLGTDEQGILMSLMGSRAAELEQGNDDLRTFIRLHPDHPAAAAARLVVGVGVAREFKSVDEKGIVHPIAPDYDEAVELLDPVLNLDRLARRQAPSDPSLDRIGEPGQEPVREPLLAADDRASRTGRTAAETLASIGTKAGITTSIDAFIISRRHEILAGLRGVQPR